MDQNHHLLGLLFFLLFLISTSSSSARNLASKQGEVDEKMINMSSKESTVNIGSFNSFDKLMGLDQECQNEDVKCLKRRAIAEVHLDYIYTQHHNP